MVATLRVDGIVRSPNGMIAVVSNPQMRVYFLREGDHLYDGEVEHITMEGVSFHQTGKDAFGKPVEREVPSGFIQLQENSNDELLASPAIGRVASGERSARSVLAGAQAPSTVTTPVPAADVRLAGGNRWRQPADHCASRGQRRQRGHDLPGLRAYGSASGGGGF